MTAAPPPITPLDLEASVLASRLNHTFFSFSFQICLGDGGKSIPKIFDSRPSVGLFWGVFFLLLLLLFFFSLSLSLSFFFFWLGVGVGVARLPLSDSSRV